MKVVILIGGKGSRLNPITFSKPKCMVKVNGIPIIELLIQNYIHSDISQKDIYLVTGYKSEFVKKYVLNVFPNINFIEDKHYEKRNNMHGLHLFLSSININKNEELIVNNGDCVYESSILFDFIKSSKTNSIACDRSQYKEDSMKIIIKNNKIYDISKDISRQNACAASIDLYKFNYSSIQKLKEIIKNYIDLGQLHLWTEVAIKDLLSKEDFVPFYIDGKKWVEIDNFEDLSIADYLFSNINLDEKKCFIFDLDGTVYLGKTPIYGTIKFIKNYSVKYDVYFLTNNTSKIPIDNKVKLSRYGILTDETHIITPFDSLFDYIKSKGIKTIFLLANKKVSEYIKKKTGLKYSKNSDVFILTYDNSITFKKLKDSCLFLQNKSNAIYIATHTDVFCPTENGKVPDIGSYINLLKTLTCRDPDIIFGKPNPVLLKKIKKKYNSKQVVIVGDRIYTDKKLADNFGCDFICVLSGETKREDLESLSYDDFPSLIIKDLGVLYE